MSYWYKGCHSSLLSCKEWDESWPSTFIAHLLSHSTYNVVRCFIWMQIDSHHPLLSLCFSWPRVSLVFPFHFNFLDITHSKLTKTCSCLLSQHIISMKDLNFLFVVHLLYLMSCLLSFCFLFLVLSWRCCLSFWGWGWRNSLMMRTATRKEGESSEWERCFISVTDNEVLFLLYCPQPSWYYTSFPYLVYHIIF